MARSTLLVMLVAGIMLADTTSASSQTVIVTGGAMLGGGSSTDTNTMRQASAQVGSRLWLSDLFQVQGGLTLQNHLAAEAALLLRPFSDYRTLDPYAFVGFGSFFGADEQRSVVPFGVGVEYHLSEQLGLLFEVAARWQLYDRQRYETDLAFGFMPAVGFAYNLGYMARPPIEGGTIFAEAEAPPAEQEPPPAPVPAAPRPSTPVATPARPTPAADSNQAGVTYFDVYVPEDTVTLKMRDRMVLVPDGTFILGLTDEDPLQLQTAGLRRITLSRFYIDQHEVSNADYLNFLSEMAPERRAALMPDTTMGQATGNRFGWSEYLRGAAYAHYPVVGVTFDQARQYCEYYDKRLPSEAEWEYAARAGQLGGVYPWPGLEPRDDAGRFQANYNPGRGGYAADGYAFTAPVDAFPPSRWNIYNMSGNVAEWCQDTVHPSYSTLSDFNPMHVDPNETRRIVRGGSWASDAFSIGVGIRDAQAADEASPYVGFRCVQDISVEGE